MGSQIKKMLQHTIGGLTAALSVHSWYTTTKTYNNQVELENLRKEMNNLTSNLRSLNDSSVTSTEKSSFIEAKNLNLTEHLEKLDSFKKAISEKEGLLSNTAEDAKSSILSEINHLTDLTNSELKKCIDASRELNNKIRQLSSNNTTSSHQAVEGVSNQSNVTSSQNIDTNLDLSNIQESNVLGPLYDFIDAYQKGLSTLSAEQLGCLSNTIGFILVLSAFTSIVTILFGEYLVQKLQLETRLPKLARYLKMRQKINKYFILYNVIFIYFILIAYICLNVFMFFQVKH